jgi:hypothetical protein
MPPKKGTVTLAVRLSRYFPAPLRNSMPISEREIRLPTAKLATALTK